MPSWNIHLEAGERIADKLHFSDQEKQKFLVGCLLPDINNGYINSPKSIYPHEETHYAFDEKSSLNFYADYSQKIKEKDPIFLGYLFHLFLDGYFNYDFYHKAKHSPAMQNLNDNQKRDIKHHDFWLFDTNFHHELHFTPALAIKIVLVANQIKNVNITPDDLLEVSRIMQDGHLNDSMRNESYSFYTEEELYQLLKDSIDEFFYQYFESATPGPNRIKGNENAWTSRSRDH